MTCTRLAGPAGHEARHLHALVNSGLTVWKSDLLGWPPGCEAGELGNSPLLVRPSLEGDPLATYLASYELTDVITADLGMWTSRVEVVAARLGVRPAGAVIQPLEHVDSSGVAYNVDPVTGERAVVVQAVIGLHVDLLKGVAPHDTFILGPSQLDIIEARVLIKPTMVSVSGGLQRVPSPDPLRPSLSEDEVVKVGLLLKQVEGVFGEVPLEVEWALRNGRPVIMAARPLPPELIGRRL